MNDIKGVKIARSFRFVMENDKPVMYWKHKSTDSLWLGIHEEPPKVVNGRKEEIVPIAVLKALPDNALQLLKPSADIKKEIFDDLRSVNSVDRYGNECVQNVFSHSTYCLDWLTSWMNLTPKAIPFICNLQMHFHKKECFRFTELQLQLNQIKATVSFE
jgi:hypothetical protein